MVRVVTPLEYEEEQICPLCINELDDTERAWLPCSCGYQLCLFCYDRLKTEFSNRCPNCRVEYDSDFKAGLRRRQEQVVQLQREVAAQQQVAAQAAKAAVAGAAAERAAIAKQVVPPPPPPRVPRPSPRRDLHIEQEQLWPSLGAAPQQLPLQMQPQPQPHSPSDLRQAPPAADAIRLCSPPRLASILPQLAPSCAEQEASSSSSADTAATTPQSPVSSVVCFRALPLQAGAAIKPLTAAVAAPVQGRCAVVLQRGGLGVDADPEGSSLAASLQEAVRAGSLSVKQAAASLASHLRQRQLLQASSLPGGRASSSPARGSRQPSSAGSTGVGGPAITPFTLGGVVGGCAGLLGGESSPMLPSHSDFGTSTSASLSHWVPSAGASLPMPAPATLPALFGGSAASWQHEAQHSPAVASPSPAAAASPVRDNGKMPLFMRRGSVPAGAGPSGSPSSVAGPSSPPNAASFPGFIPSSSTSPTAELKRMMAPPPGFGPAQGATTGIAALPRFR